MFSVSGVVGANSANQIYAASSASTNGKSTAVDPIVKARVDKVLSASAQTVEGPNATAYQISQIVNDKTLTSAQKEEIVSTLVKISGGEETQYGKASKDQQKKLLAAFEIVGSAYGSAQTGDPQNPETRDALTNIISSATASGKLDANALYYLVDPTKNPKSDGARQLMSDIKDGRILTELSFKLNNAATQFASSKNSMNLVPEALVASSDFANMASANGYKAAANDTVRTIERLGKVFKGENSLVQEMLRQSEEPGNLVPSGTIAGRTGYEVLTKLINSTQPSLSRTSQAIVTATDSLFAQLVRSGSDNVAGGSDTMTGISQPANSLGQYMNKNFVRLSELDATHRNSKNEDQYSFILRDFYSNVFFNKDFTDRKQHAATVSDYLNKELAVINAGPNSDAAKIAADRLGAVIGSMDAGAHDYVKRVGDAAEIDTSMASFVTDIGLGMTPLGPVGGAVGSLAIGQLFGALANKYQSGKINEATGEAANAAAPFQALFEEIFKQIGVSSPDVFREFDEQLDLTAKDRSQKPIVYH